MGRRQWTEEDYLEVSDRRPRVELSDGVLEVLPLPTERHQALLMALLVVLHGYAAKIDDAPGAGREQAREKGPFCATTRAPRWCRRWAVVGEGNGRRAYLACAALLAACGQGDPPARRDAATAGDATLAGRYWGRWDAVPDGMRVEVWLDADNGRVRGAWALPPWSGSFEGTLDGDRLSLEWREESTVGMRQIRYRPVVLRRDPRTGALRGGRGDGGRAGVELVRARLVAPTLRPGLWLSRWTGLPQGAAVETVLTRDPDGPWRAAYRYQEREGAFTGDVRRDGALAIRWVEVSPRDTLARGAGLLRAGALGWRGTFGVNESAEGTGEWALEPFAE